MSIAHRHSKPSLPLLSLMLLCLAGCRIVRGVVRSEGEHALQIAPPSAPEQPHLLVFAMDGVGYDQFMSALRSARAPHLETIIGRPAGANLYQHAYSVPDATTVMPSCSVPGWGSIVTGYKPADTGLAGDEFFVRDENRFYAPIALSSRDPSDFISAIDKDLLGKVIRVPTVYERIKGASFVSLLYLYHGAAEYSTLDTRTLVNLVGDVIAGKVEGEDVRQSIAAPIDDGSASEAVKLLHDKGIPSLMVVYFPGPDIYAHGSPHPLASQVRYLETTIDPDVGRVVREYAVQGALQETYIVFVSDHGHTPVLKDDAHDLDNSERSALAAFLHKMGFRVRKPGVKLGPEEQDFQAVIADQGFSAYLYLADRSSCRKKGRRCDWRKPPRFERDLMPVLRALYRGNRGRGAGAAFNRKLDLIFSRDYSTGPGAATPRDSLPFQVFDGEKLVPVHTYFSEHPRPDLIDVERRIAWLGQGPYGGRAGDIMIVANSSTERPIQQRYYFSNATYFAWHGSFSRQDSHVPMIVANQSASGEELKRIVDGVVGNPPSVLDLVPIIESLLGYRR